MSGWLVGWLGGWVGGWVVGWLGDWLGGFRGCCMDWFSFWFTYHVLLYVLFVRISIYYLHLHVICCGVSCHMLNHMFTVFMFSLRACLFVCVFLFVLLCSVLFVVAWSVGWLVGWLVGHLVDSFANLFLCCKPACRVGWGAVKQIQLHVVVLQTNRPGGVVDVGAVVVRPTLPWSTPILRRISTVKVWPLLRKNIKYAFPLCESDYTPKHTNTTHEPAVTIWPMTLKTWGILPPCVLFPDMGDLGTPSAARKPCNNHKAVIVNTKSVCL